VRPSPNGGDGEERARRQLSPQRRDDVGGTVEFSVQGGAPMVGVVKKATGRGVLPVGCFRVRIEEGGREPRRDDVGRLPFERRWGEVGEGWGSGLGKSGDAWREKGHERGAWA
jgi:hypothetical protein